MQNQTKSQKTLIILGSHREESNTLDLAQKKFPGSPIIDLTQMKIHTFNYNVKEREAGYADEDFDSIVKQMINAETLVFATPVYWYSMSGRMKVFFDRFSDLITGERKALGRALKTKKVWLLATGHDVDLPAGFETPFMRTSQWFEMDYQGAIYQSYPK